MVEQIIDRLVEHITKLVGALDLKKRDSLYSSTHHALHLNGLGLKSLPISIILELNNHSPLHLLNLSDNKLDSLPEETTQLSALQELVLSGNKIKTLPENIGELTNLKALYLGKNQISTLPSSITQLHNLNRLMLFDNQLSEVPSFLSELHNLTLLAVYGNNLSSFPIEIITKTNLMLLLIADAPSDPLVVDIKADLDQLDVSKDPFKYAFSTILGLDLWDGMC